MTDPSVRSWVESANTGTTDFPIQNLPYGIFRRRASRRVGVAIGDQILDLAAAVDGGLLNSLPDSLQQAVRAPSLNALMALGPAEGSRLRQRIVELLAAAPGSPASGSNRIHLVPMREAEMLLPAEIGDYTDFYASIFHATHVGSLFRPDNPLLPNYKHIPIAYHGRSSSIRVSGTPITRPHGQVKGANDQPVFGPTARLDYELELGLFVGAGNAVGDPIPIDRAESHIFGLCVVNDWSARDIQAWEYQPLGPFLAKNFATTVSPWVVTLEALAPFRCAAAVRPSSDPHPLPYLSSSANDAGGGLDITFEVSLRSAAMRRAGHEALRLSRGSFRDMYGTPAQLVAHHTINGCNLRPGDLLASGTISGDAPGTEGCLLELTRHRPIELPSGEQRTFLADEDEVIMRAFCARPGYVRIGFGECTGIVRPARQMGTS